MMFSQGIYIIILIIAPVVFGVLAWLARSWNRRTPVIILSVLSLPLAAIALVIKGNAVYHFAPWSQTFAFGLELFAILTFVMLGWRIKQAAVSVLAVIQLTMVAYGHFGLPEHASEAPQLVVDALSMVLILVVSLIGSLIVLYAVGYMEKHEHHAPATAASTGRFFFFLIGFLGCMNGLVLANDLAWLAIFWEFTTLCSFMLIGHDGTPIAKQNALRAILINLAGGIALSSAALLAKASGAGESLTGIMASNAMLPMAFLTVAAFTKSAQLPFQSWLLGAMVAPTPVSALLHSSTMVKAGSYLVLRLSPAFAGTHFAPMIAVAGAFTFAMASALAIGQSNGKKVLAYSTIANLGLIVACAGIGTPVAYAAGVMILCFHALSKALLFLCMGNIEQTIGTREIEAMMGLLEKMPVTTVLAIIGMVSMFVPPFSMLISKWIAIEASIDAPVVLILIVIGSALTVLFWAKWIGRIITAPYEKLQMERFSVTMLIAMSVLVIGVISAGVLVFPVYNKQIIPYVMYVFRNAPFRVSEWEILKAVGHLMEWPIFLVLAAVVVAMLLTLRKIQPSQIRLPYLAGENLADAETPYIFRTVLEKPQPARLTSYYFTHIFGEDVLTRGVNLIAIANLFLMFGMIWKP